MSVFTLSIIIFSDLRNILKDEIKVKHLWNSLVSLKSKNLTKDQGGFYYSQTSFLKLFGSKSKCVFAVGKIPIQLARWEPHNLPRQLDLREFRSTTYKVKGYKKKENFLKGIKKIDITRRGATHTVKKIYGALQVAILQGVTKEATSLSCYCELTEEAKPHMWGSRERLPTFPTWRSNAAGSPPTGNANQMFHTGSVSLAGQCFEQPKAFKWSH